MVVAIAGAAIAASTIGAGALSASSQSKAAKEAAGMQQDASFAAIDLQREQMQLARRDIAPWREAGIRGLRQYQALAQQGPPDMPLFRAPQELAPGQFTFRPPTAADLQRDPGYQFRLQQGQQALERSAAARGGLLSGGFARGLAQYSQGLASQEYGNVYQRKMGENQLRYGRALTRNQSAYERALQQYQTRYNAGMGQWHAQLEPWQRLAYGGQNASTQMAQLGGNYASQVGEIMRANAANQGAAGLQQANIWGNFATGAASTLGNLGMLYAGGMGNNPARTQPNSGGSPYDPWEFPG